MNATFLGPERLKRFSCSVLSNTSLRWCELHLTGKKVGSGKASDLQGFASNMRTAVKLALDRLNSAQSLREGRMYLLEILKGEKNP